ncbi:MAG: hypothetical protein M1834_004646 [Cirrosporium novae-zelandiae]|nr:MAG: hypothetical protein M1834_004646 [Cirrosporium novae-zelandiae]
MTPSIHLFAPANPSPLTAPPLSAGAPEDETTTTTATAPTTSTNFTSIVHSANAIAIRAERARLSERSKLYEVTATGRIKPIQGETRNQLNQKLARRLKRAAGAAQSAKKEAAVTTRLKGLLTASRKREEVFKRKVREQEAEIERLKREVGEARGEVERGLREKEERGEVVSWAGRPVRKCRVGKGKGFYRRIALGK